MTLVLVLGLAMNAIALPIVARRVWWLFRLITSGQPAPDRIEGVTQRIGAAVKTQIVEVFGQQKLLKWSIPGAAHFFVFWAFLVLGSVYVEAYGALFDPDFHIPLVGTWPVLGFAQDLIAILALVGILTFAVIRVRQSPARLGRRSRFKGSHLGGAWMVLFMIFNVLWSMFLFRGAAANEGHLPYDSGAFVSEAVGRFLEPLGEGANETLEHVGLLLHIGVMLSFLVLVVYSKHLHIFVAPLNVLFSRRPVALGAVKPLTSKGVAVTLDDIDDLDEDAQLGVGAVEDFTWKGMLDFATCTECGRCQDQCPAWNTEKPLSPKLLILQLRDHAFAKGPHILADEDARESLSDQVKAEAARPLIGDESAYGVIDPDVLWSCVTCGACVEQCPVDIEHVDHIVDMRRYQVLVEANFPAELNQLFKGMENKGNPWNMAPTARLDWTKGLDFDVPVVGDTLESLDSVDWLFWVGCAGAYEDRAKKTTRAVAELLNIAGVSFGVLGNGETCTGDPARRAGNEFVFQGLAQQNAETLTAAKAKKVVSTCAHCFNTLKNEYAAFGLELEVVHHTQLLNRLVREGKLTPVADGAGAARRSITYHDPCYLGRHNQVYSPPRELLAVLPGAEFVEMGRNSERSFCCGAGGARMWMEENIGQRINVNRTTEAVGTNADQIAVGCPFCRVMLSDGLTSLQANGEAREEVEVLDVAQLLLASVKGESATRAPRAAAATGAPPADVATKAEPQAGDETQTEDTVSATEDVGPAAKASGGSSLFDVAEDEPARAEPEEPSPGGSLFDVAPAEPEPDATANPEPKPGSSMPAAGSLFDIATSAPEPEPAPEPEAEAEVNPKATTEAEQPTPSAGDDDTEGSDLSAGAALSQAATFGASEEDPDTILDADDQPEPDAEPETEPETEQSEPEAKRAPASQPKTSADVNEAGSLFDL